MSVDEGGFHGANEQHEEITVLCDRLTAASTDRGELLA